MGSGRSRRNRFQNLAVSRTYLSVGVDALVEELAGVVHRDSGR